MKLIVGGAYQGKRAYARDVLGVPEEAFVTCSETEIPDFSAACLDRLEEFVLYCVKNGLSARSLLEENRNAWQNSVLICREIFSGIVPIDDTVRAWREETGRVFTWLAGEAESVTRLFLGIPQILK